ncbi:MAG TPA: hypothetical protein VHW64_17455, partial [Nocardioides sp.]|nr:hypothetical protein [Nocardioides sp.]
MKRSNVMRARVAIAALASVAVLPAVALATGVAPAQAAGVNDQAVSGVASPIWQPNGVVDAVAGGNGVIYAGGNFTSVKPPTGGSGSPTARTYLAAFDATTGNLITTFNFTLNGRVYALDLSPDKKTLYVGGAFSTVNGVSHNHIVAINLTTGALNTTFAAAANRNVRAIESTSSTVYIGGDFTTVKNQTQAYMASISATNGALNTAFAPTFLQRPAQTCPTNPPPGCTTTTYTPNVLAIKVSPDGSRVL